jgi:hypothetical protein
MGRAGKGIVGGAILLLGALSAAGCIDDSSKTPNATFDAKPPDLPPIDAALTDTYVPPPILDASGDGPAFATGLGAGATVTKSGKYTLITKTGGSPGGHGISTSPAHKELSGAAAASRK